jgi:hypothetical protein
MLGVAMGIDLWPGFWTFFGAFMTFIGLFYAQKGNYIM